MIVGAVKNPQWWHSQSPHRAASVFFLLPSTGQDFVLNTSQKYGCPPAKRTERWAISSRDMLSSGSPFKPKNKGTISLMNSASTARDSEKNWCVEPLSENPPNFWTVLCTKIFNSLFTETKFSSMMTAPKISNMQYRFFFLEYPWIS